MPDSIRELWRYRRFVLGSVAREFRSRYSRTVFGAAWLLLSPFAMIAVYTIVFSQLMRGSIEGATGPFSYSIFLCAGLLPWQWFSELLGRMVGLFVDNGALIRKNRLPHSALISIAVLSSAVNFALSFGLFLAFLAAIGRFPGITLFALVPLLVLQCAFASSLGLILALLNVFFRDVGQTTSLVLQFWFWFTPIIYPLASLPETIRPMLEWNPMLPLVQSYQSILSGSGMPDWRSLSGLIGLITAQVILGFWLWKKAHGQMIDEL